ncbi:hypothetical protein SDC9_90644 [bioreactor metagenome]|uniref:Uncharacterized protein n=1 Tax=bioreactor metagenome TaxID=1076179 RepID=A0A644ZT98_9ZZZZ
MITELTVIGSIPSSSRKLCLPSRLLMAMHMLNATGTVHSATRRAMRVLLVKAPKADPICPVARSRLSSWRYHFRLNDSVAEREEEAMNERMTTEAIGPRMKRKEETV